MNRVQLIMDGETRTVLQLHYEYFHPAEKSDEKYLKILHKNFPYTFSDGRNTFPYCHQLLPVLEHGRLDKDLASSARFSSFSQKGAILGDQDRSEKNYYYQELTRLRLGDKFRAWYILQHVKGYRPFLTVMTTDIEVKNQKFQLK